MRHPGVTYASGVQQPGGGTGRSRGGLDIDIGLRLPATSGLTAGFADLADAIRAWAGPSCPLSCWSGTWLGPLSCWSGTWLGPLREGFLQAAVEVFRSRQVGTAAISFGQLAHADGSSRVVAPVVETPWTGSATRDVARHSNAASSANTGLHGHGESA